MTATQPTFEDLHYQMMHIDEDRGPLINGVSIALIVIASISVTMRFAARWIRRLPSQADDYFMIPALFFTVMLCVQNIIAVSFGNGRHLVAVQPENISKLIETIYFLSLTYAVVHFFVKFSILFLYRRIFTLFNRTFRICYYITMAFVTAWALSSFFGIMFQCNPPSKLWHSDDPTYSGTCNVQTVPLELATNASNALGDLALFGLPMIMLSKLQMTLRRKLELIAIFSVGLIACAASIIRLYATYSETTNPSLSSDATYNTSDVLIWTAVEPTVGIVCACFPVVVPAFTRSAIAARFSSLRSGSSSSTGTFVRRMLPRSSSSGSALVTSSKKSTSGSKTGRTWFRSTATTASEEIVSSPVSEKDVITFAKGPSRIEYAEYDENLGYIASSLDEGRTNRTAYWGRLGTPEMREDTIRVRTDMTWEAESVDRFRARLEGRKG